MDYKRREFLKAATTVASGLAISGMAGSFMSCKAAAKSTGSTNKFGLQLYSLRDVLPQNPKNILKQVASFGYKQIESYEHDKLGIFWGMKNTEFKRYMDELGMEIVSSHWLKG